MVEKRKPGLSFILKSSNGTVKEKGYNDVRANKWTEMTEPKK